MSVIWWKKGWLLSGKNQRFSKNKGAFLARNQGYFLFLITNVCAPLNTQVPPPPPPLPGELGQLSVTYDSRVGSGILAWTTDEKKYFGYMISSARYVSLLEQTNTPTYTHACTHAQILTTPHPSSKGRWFVPKFTITCVRLRSHVIVVMKVFPELFIEASGVKTQWELIELQWDLERKLQKWNRKTSKKKDYLKIKVKSVEIFKERHWEIEKCYTFKENVKRKSLFCWTFIEN